MSDHEDETINEENAPPKAMKMQNFISSSDLLCWNIVLKGNNAKSMTTDNDGNLKIHPLITAEEHQQVQREEKARTILLSALPDEHMGDFYHMIDGRDIWNAIKARFGGNAESKKMQKSLLKQKFKEFKISEEEGLDKGYDKMQKILTQMNTLKINPGLEYINMKFLRGLPSSWSGNGGYGGYTTTLSASPGFSSSKGSLKSKCIVVDDVLYSFFANHEIDQQLVYEDLDQMNKDFEEYDLKHQMAMLSIKVHRFEKKHGQKIKFNGQENARFDKKLVKCFNCKQMGHFSRECRAQGAQTSNNYQKYKSKEAGKDGSDSKAMVVVDDADSEGEVVSADAVISANVSISAGLVATAAVSPQSEIEFALMGLSTELVYEEKIIVLSYELEEQSNILEYRQKLIAHAAQEKQDLMTKLDNELANQDKWNNSAELGIDDSVFSIFHTTSDDLDGQPIYNSDRSSKPSTNDFQTCGSSQECSRPNHSDHDSNDSISSVSAPASESRDTIVIDCAR
uniref:Ribonuclease H-like domain-containing protein n=1 Tax=Tanacetum cinerariifolium TaxID=118510 RepID=A0A699IDR2_TANCI|nr:ribonuclease H-like domain-containing protein [Tanacetum cinerariifolium]